MAGRVVNKAVRDLMFSEFTSSLRSIITKRRPPTCKRGDYRGCAYVHMRLGFTYPCSYPCLVYLVSGLSTFSCTVGAAARVLWLPTKSNLRPSSTIAQETLYKDENPFLANSILSLAFATAAYTSLYGHCHCIISKGFNRVEHD